MTPATLKFIATMKAFAAEEALEANRCRRQWRRLASVAFIAGLAGLCFAVFVTGWPLKVILAVMGICWLVAGRATWKQGDVFARQWLELREEALRHAKDAESHL